MSSSPRFIQRSFSEGVGWLSRAADLMSKGGSGLVGVAGVLLLITLVQFLPLIGGFLFVVLSPLLTAGLLTVFRVISESSRPHAGLLFAGFQDPTTRVRLLMLGFWLLIGSFVAAMVFTGWLTTQVDLDTLNQLMSDPDALNSNPDALVELLAGVNLQAGLFVMLIAGLILAVVLGGLYFAVPLVLFWKWPVTGSLLFSLRAMLSNWLAFLGFGLVLLVVFFAAGFMFAIAVGILSLALGALGTWLAQMAIVVGTLFIQLLLAATQWVAFEQVFQAVDGPGDARADDEPPNNDSNTLDL
ncbi:MAG: BPSS1780 family membrane protein [Pseudomonadota bacterium]